MNKYNAKKVTIDGITFASKSEGRYYQHLLGLMESGVVESFEMQKVFTLLDRFAHPHTGIIVRAVTYRADFEVYYTDGRVEVVDIKGFMTPEFRIKAKMFMFRYQVPLVLLKWSTASKKFVEA